MSKLAAILSKFIRGEKKEAPDEPRMDRYPEEAYLPGYKPTGPHPRIIKIVVPDQYSKDQLLLAIEHLHYLRETDTGYMAVNELVHMYQNPELIEVQDLGPPGKE
jgi:hypothetical protein